MESRYFHDILYDASATTPPPLPTHPILSSMQGWLVLTKFEFDMDVVERCDEESDNAENEYVDNAWKEMSKDKGKDKKGLTRKSISECFYMPIAEAARHLKVGLIHLKRRWRDLGIQRWPHRKLMSLQTLINNLQQQQEEGVDEDESSRILATGDHTKRLRQACFKANYNKRRKQPVQPNIMILILTLTNPFN
ncbi:hypothetical protein HN51_020815 [Arachis hypogaea]